MATKDKVKHFTLSIVVVVNVVVQLLNFLCFSSEIREVGRGEYPNSAVLPCE